MSHDKIKEKLRKMLMALKPGESIYRRDLWLKLDKGLYENT